MLYNCCTIIVVQLLSRCCPGVAQVLFSYCLAVVQVLSIHSLIRCRHLYSASSSGTIVRSAPNPSADKQCCFKLLKDLFAVQVMFSCCQSVVQVIVSSYPIVAQLLLGCCRVCAST